MTKLLRITAAPLALVMLLGACQKSGDAPPESRQVELAPAPTAQPQLGDTAQVAVPTPAADVKAAATAPPRTAAAAAPKPAPAKPAAAPRPAAAPSAAPVATPATGTIAAGTALHASSASRICTNTHRVGDRISATLAADVDGTNGVAILAGATVTLRVTEAVRGENGKEGIRLAFEPISVSYGSASYEITGSASVASLETVRAQTTGDQAKKVAVGAAVGALAGQLLGKKTKSTVVGAAVGAAAGGAVAAGSADWNGCLPTGGHVQITLTGPLTVKRAP